MFTELDEEGVPVANVGTSGIVSADDTTLETMG
jgi:hypothetical protein